MHRTQILLEQWQLEALRARARAEGTSMGAVVRSILSEHLAQGSTRGRKALESIFGMSEGPGDLGRRHDDYLYGPIRDASAEDGSHP